jgi:hypothetical protein
MSIPLSGMIFIPLSLVIFVFAPEHLPRLAIIAAIFAASAVVSFGGASFPVGISPFYFTALLIAVRCAPKWLNGGLHMPISKPLRHHVQIITGFTVWAGFSAFVLPLLFNGLPVDLARAGADSTYYSRMPLHWSLSNAGQAGYLVLDLIVVLYLMKHSESADTLERMYTAFSWSGLIVVAVGAYQWLAHRVGLPFPLQLFNSNPAWAELANQDIGGISRISATFNESSGAGAFLPAWLSFEFLLGTKSSPASLRHLIFALAGILMVIATTSTTGYVTTAAMLFIILFRSLFSSSQRGSVRAAVLAGLVLIAAYCLFITTDHGSALLAEVMLDKYHSGSSLHRTATVVRSWDIFTATYGLGAGLGSNRAMSLLAYVVSNLGFTGTILFFWLLLSLFSLHRGNPSVATDDSRPLFQALGTAFVARFLALSESGAEVSDPILWLLWGLLLAAIRQRWLIAAIRARASPGDPRRILSDGFAYTKAPRDAARADFSPA